MKEILAQIANRFFNKAPSELSDTQARVDFPGVSFYIERVGKNIELSSAHAAGCNEMGVLRISHWEQDLTELEIAYSDGE